MSPLLFHQATRLVEVPGEPAAVYPRVHATAGAVGRITRSAPAHGSLLVRVRRRLGSVQAGVHVQPGHRPGFVVIEIVTMAGGVTDATATAVADLLAERLRRELHD